MVILTIGKTCNGNIGRVLFSTSTQLLRVQILGEDLLNWTRLGGAITRIEVIWHNLIILAPLE